MNKSEYKMLTQEDMQKLYNNEIWENYPSGCVFQGFRHLYIEVSVGVVEHRTKAVYENGFPCEPLVLRKLLKGARLSELTDTYLAAQGQEVKLVHIPKCTESWNIYSAIKRCGDFHPHVRVEYCPY